MNDQNQTKGRGCLFYGCFVALLLGLAIVGGTYFGVRSVVNKFVNNYTSPTPMVLPVVDMPAAESEALRARVDDFRQALAGGTNPPSPLALDTRELNALIATWPDFKPLKDRVYLSIQSNRLSGQISLPADQIVPLARMKGRYLNGAAAFKVSMENGVLLVIMDSLQILADKVPENVMVKLRQQNLAKDVYANAHAAAALQRIGSITITDDQLVITPSLPPEAEAPR